MKMKLISSAALMGILFTASLYAFDSGRGGADRGFDRAGGTFDREGSIDRGNDNLHERNRSEEPNFEKEDYEVSAYKKGRPLPPGSTPIYQIQGDTPPPYNSIMSRMIGESGSVMGNHD